MRSTGFSRPQVATLRTRDSDRCVWTGNHTERLIPQHRVNRGMGGNRDLNVLVNGVLLDSIVNGLIEADPTLAVVAKAFGVKVERWANPADVPVFYAHDHAWYALEGDSRRQITGVQAIDMMQASPLPRPRKPRGLVMPGRIQQRRTKGWRKPENTVSVARPSKWGNPFAAQIPHGEALQPSVTRSHLVAMYRRWLTTGERFDDIAEAMPLEDAQGRIWRMHSRHTTRPTPREIRAELGGKNLMCFCPLDQPCHADVLLELANGGT